MHGEEPQSLGSTTPRDSTLTIHASLSDGGESLAMWITLKSIKGLWRSSARAYTSFGVSINLTAHSKACPLRQTVTSTSARFHGNCTKFVSSKCSLSFSQSTLRYCCHKVILLQNVESIHCCHHSLHICNYVSSACFHCCLA